MAWRKNAAVTKSRSISTSAETLPSALSFHRSRFRCAAARIACAEVQSSAFDLYE